MKVFSVILSFLIILVPTVEALTQEIKLGFITTGYFASIEKEAAMVAVQNASKAIGTKITIISLDCGCTEGETKSAINILKDAKVLAIIGSFCGIGIPSASAFSKEIEIPIISINPVSNNILKLGYPWFFSEVLKVRRMAKAIASEMEKLDVKEITGLASDNSYGKIGLDYWKKTLKKIKISSEATFPVSTVDFSPYLASVKKTKGLVFISSDQDAFYGIKQALKFGFKPKVIGGVFFPAPEFFKHTEDITMPIIFPILYPPDLSKNKEFFAKISTPEDLKRFSQSLYRSKDIIDVLAIAITQASDWSPKAIRDSFQSVTTKKVFDEGLAGRIKIDPKTNEWLQELYVGKWLKDKYTTAGGPHNHEP